MLLGGDLSQNQFESFNDDWWWSSVIHINESVPTQTPQKMAIWYIYIYESTLFFFAYAQIYKESTLKGVLVHPWLPKSGWLPFWSHCQVVFLHSQMVPRSHYMIQYAKWVDIWSVANLSLMIAYFLFFLFYHLLPADFSKTRQPTSRRWYDLVCPEKGPWKGWLIILPYATVGWMYKYV